MMQPGLYCLDYAAFTWNQRLILSLSKDDPANSGPYHNGISFDGLRIRSVFM